MWKGKLIFYIGWSKRSQKRWCPVRVRRSEGGCPEEELSRTLQSPEVRQGSWNQGGGELGPEEEPAPGYHIPTSCSEGKDEPLKGSSGRSIICSIFNSIQQKSSISLWQLRGFYMHPDLETTVEVTEWWEVLRFFGHILKEEPEEFVVGLEWDMSGKGAPRKSCDLNK